MLFSKYLSAAVGVAALFGAVAHAGNLNVSINDERRLPDCGGYVQITKSPQGNYGEQVNLVFRGVESCSNFDILKSNGESVSYDNKKLQGGQGNYHGSFTLPKRVLDYGWNNVQVVVRSNSGNHRDVIRVHFVAVGMPEAPRMPAPVYPSLPAPDPVYGGWDYHAMNLTIGDEALLPYCGGYVRVTRSPQGNNGEQINLVFRGVRQCSNFVIASSTYQAEYYSKKLQGDSSGTYHGSFTLPKSVIDYGWNNIRIVVQSNSGKHADSILVTFVEVGGAKLPAAPAPLPAAPSSGSGTWN